MTTPEAAEHRADEQRAAADLLAAAWDGRGVINTPDGPATGTDSDW